VRSGIEAHCGTGCDERGRVRPSEKRGLTESGWCDAIALMAKRQVVLLGLAMAVATSGRAQQQSIDQPTLGELYSGDASVHGSVLVRAQATQVMSGSQIAAGEGIALLKLKRGGQVRICPRTKLSLASDASGKALSLGLDAGAMELQYNLQGGADSLLTPDFRLQLISPGIFHLAISVGVSGDTCLQSLPGADAAVFVTEMMGDESYQLSPGKKVLFREGRIASASDTADNCGCAEAPPAPLRVAETTPAAPPQPPKAQTPATSASAEVEAPPPLPRLIPEHAVLAVSSLSATPPAGPSEQAATAIPQVAAQSQFAYTGDLPEQDFYAAAARLPAPINHSRLALALLPQVAPWTEEGSANSEPAVARPDSGGFFHRLFHRMFGGH
jgi:hypothetical protein